MKNLSFHFRQKLNRYLILISVPLLISSCDCLQKVEGKVYDTQSMKALTDVVIYKQNQSYSSIKSDTSGSFKFSDIDGGRNCSNVSLVFEKTGYKSDTISFSANTSGAIVKLSK